MPEFRIRVSETIYYEIHVEAETEDEARAEAERQLYEDDELDLYEVDSSGLEIV